MGLTDAHASGLHPGPTLHWPPLGTSLVYLPGLSFLAVAGGQPGAHCLGYQGSQECEETDFTTVTPQSGGCGVGGQATRSGCAHGKVMGGWGCRTLLCSRSPWLGKGHEKPPMKGTGVMQVGTMEAQLRAG